MAVAAVAPTTVTAGPPSQQSGVQPQPTIPDAAVRPWPSRIAQLTSSCLVSLIPFCTIVRIDLICIDEDITKKTQKSVGVHLSGDVNVLIQGPAMGRKYTPRYTYRDGEDDYREQTDNDQHEDRCACPGQFQHESKQ